MICKILHNSKYIPLLFCNHMKINFRSSCLLSTCYMAVTVLGVSLMSKLVLYGTGEAANYPKFRGQWQSRAGPLPPASRLSAHSQPCCSIQLLLGVCSWLPQSGGLSPSIRRPEGRSWLFQSSAESFGSNTTYLLFLYLCFPRITGGVSV